MNAATQPTADRFAKGTKIQIKVGTRTSTFEVAAKFTPNAASWSPESYVMAGARGAPHMIQRAKDGDRWLVSQITGKGTRDAWVNGSDITVIG